MNTSDEILLLQLPREDGLGWLDSNLSDTQLFVSKKSHRLGRRQNLLHVGGPGRPSVVGCLPLKELIIALWFLIKHLLLGNRNVSSLDLISVCCPVLHIKLT